MVRTRIIEIPLCDLCNRDGAVYRVVPIANGEAFTICRCDRHVEKLRKEGGEESPIKSSVATDIEVASARRATIKARLLTAINNNPGLHPREYAEMIGASSDSVSTAAVRLKRDGLIKMVGATSSSRYYPKETDEQEG